MATGILNTLDHFEKQVIHVVGSIPEIGQALDHPPVTLTDTLEAVVYSIEGRSESQPDTDFTTYDNVMIGLFAPLDDLSIRVEQMRPFRMLVPYAINQALKDNMFDGIEGFGIITHTFGDTTWGGVPKLGYRFVIEEVKIQNVIE